jgi:sterol desaturase/sphingolipid hydroxylase (fatty acid hydroxylase superfamily)
MSLVGILVALIIIGVLIFGVLIWAIQKVLAVIGIPEPFKTIIWVIVVVVAVFLFLDLSGLYSFQSIRIR